MTLPVVAVAFDGVVAIVNRWPQHTEQDLEAEIIPGARGWIGRAVLQVELHIVEPRALGPHTRMILLQWLEENLGELSREVTLTGALPIAYATFLDARAQTFTGTFPPALSLVEHRPWYVGRPRPAPGPRR